MFSMIMKRMNTIYVHFLVALPGYVIFQHNTSIGK